MIERDGNKLLRNVGYAERLGKLIQALRFTVRRNI